MVTSTELLNYAKKDLQEKIKDKLNVSNKKALELLNKSLLSNIVINEILEQAEFEYNFFDKR